MSDQSAVETLKKELTDVTRRARELAALLSPVTPAMVAAAPTWRAAYSDRTCALMASLCGVAYDNFEDQTGAGLDLMRVRLRSGGFKLVEVYDTPIGSQAYLATSDQMTVLVFRGTQDRKDWAVNLEAALTPLNTLVGAVRVHRGFLEAFQKIEAKIRRDLDDPQKIPVDKGLYITGHSLGGALAQIASAAFERDTLAACYTFGSPRVGQRSFDTEVKCPHYRLVNEKDVVASVPPSWLGFSHSGDVRFLTKDGELRHDRPPASLLLRFFWFGFWWVFTRKFPLIDDHMIGVYRQKLIAAADLRSPGWTDPA